MLLLTGLLLAAALLLTGTLLALILLAWFLLTRILVLLAHSGSPLFEAVSTNADLRKWLRHDAEFHQKYRRDRGGLAQGCHEGGEEPEPRQLRR